MSGVKYIIGITGGSGVGKSTLIRILYEEFQDRVSTLSLDNYYKPKEEQVRDENGVINFDLPTALNTDLLEKDLELLVSGKSIEHEIYRFNNPSAPKRTKHIDPKELLIVEGLFVMHYPFIRKHLDYSVFLSVDPKIQLERRLRRDVNERNYTKEDVLYQWENHVIPSFEEFVVPYKSEADLVITNDTHFDENIHTLTAVIHENLDTAK